MTSTLSIDGHKLSGHSPSTGAHRLAHWLKAKGQTGWRLLANGAALRSAQLERIFAGEIVPGDDLRLAIARETEGDVMPGDWDHGGGKPWTDAPGPRVDMAA